MIVLKRLTPFLVNKLAYYAFFFTLLSLEQEFNSLLIYITIFFSFIIGIGILGYFLNDISDIKQDQLAAKTNLASKLSAIQKTLILTLLLLVGFIPISVYVPKTIPFVLIEIALLLIYSFPPIRLKERGFLGIITDSLYAYVFPIIIMLIYLSELITVHSFYWCFLPIFSFFVGIKNILAHQLEDLDNDQIAGVKTFATKNKQKTHSFEITTAITAVAIWETALLYVLFNNFSNSITTCFLVIGIVYLFRTIAYFTYKEEKYLTGMPEFDLIYYGVIVITIIAIIENQYQYFYLSLFLLNKHAKEKIWNVSVIFYVFIRPILSFIINYTLYYLFLLVGINLKERVKNKKKFIQEKPITDTVNIIELQEKNVHGLWIGNELSLMEMLTIKSFIRHGYTFHIWTYESLKNKLPNECIVCDANVIIPAEEVFKYKYASQFGTGKGSYAGFSDIFRYKLLYEQGGWWVDMDVTCLKPFDVEAPYFFRGHHDLLLVGNIVKVPKGSELMLKCYEEASREIDKNNRDWHKPIEILVKNVQKLNLDKYIVQGVSNTDEWHKIKPLVHKNQKKNSTNWHFIHWCNEMWRSNGYNKNNPLYSSYYGQLLMKYRIIVVLPKNEWKTHDGKLKRKLSIERILEYL